MAEENEVRVISLAEKFKQASLELDEDTDLPVQQTEDGATQGIDEWENCLI
ncbi:hypothetical protein MKX03_015193, partial [Papaver bracteatum]